MCCVRWQHCWEEAWDSQSELAVTRAVFCTVAGLAAIIANGPGRVGDKHRAPAKPDPADGEQRGGVGGVCKEHTRGLRWGPTRVQPDPNADGRVRGDGSQGGVQLRVRAGAADGLKSHAAASGNSQVRQIGRALWPTW